MNQQRDIALRIEIKVLLYMLSLLLCGVGILAVNYLSSKANFVIVFSLLWGILLANLYIFRKIIGPMFWQNLPMILTIYVFLALFIPTLLIYKSTDLKDLLEWNDFLILKASMLGVVFVQGLWMSYHLGVSLIPKIRLGVKPTALTMDKIYIMLMIAMGTNVLAVVSGTFGVLQNIKVDQTANFSVFIDLGQQLGLFALIILNYYHTSRKLLIGGLAIVLFGIGVVSAQKQAALMPLFVVGITLLFKTGRFPKGIVLLTIVGTLLAFITVTSIRKYYFAQHLQGVTSLAQVKEISTMALNQQNFNKAYKTYDVKEHILMRLFYGNAIGKAIEYSEKNGFGVPDDSELYHVLLSPFYAVVPRFLFPDKPEADFGNWFASQIFVGYKVKYSIGITPIGYGYMVNGMLGVIAVSILLGLFMAFLYRVLVPDHILLYIMVYVKTILPADVTWEYFAGNLKLILVYAIIYYMLTIRIFPRHYLANIADKG
mgnify:CR=1 FL=1